MAKSLKALRDEYKERGVFYTPMSLVKEIVKYIDIPYRSVYDPACGGGNMLSAFPAEVLKYGQDIEQAAFDGLSLPNFTGVYGDTLTNDAFAGMKFDVVIANPPYSLKWDSQGAKGDPRFAYCDALAPNSRADWAFIEHCLYHTADNGMALCLNAPGVAYRGNSELKIRKAFVDAGYIERVVLFDGGQFEDTQIPTLLFVMRKRKERSVTFEHGARSAVVEYATIVANDYDLSPTRYIQEEQQKEEVDIDNINLKCAEAFCENLIAKVRNTISLAEVFGDTIHLEIYERGLREALEMIKSS